MSSDSEDFVERLCNEMFFRDFVVRSPGFKKGAGRSKEASDVLVPFLDRLLSIQVRSRNLPAVGPDEVSEVDRGRLERKILAAVGQVKTIKRAIDSRKLQMVFNSRGFEVPFDCDFSWSITGLVVIDTPLLTDCSGKRYPELGVRVAYDQGIPIHTLHREDLERTTAELGTLPDLFEYLDARQRLSELGIVGPGVKERDFLAAYKSRWLVIDEVLTGKRKELRIKSGEWEIYRERFSEEIRRRDDGLAASRLLDSAIDYLHTSVGHDPNVPGFDAADERTYLTPVRDLASMKRLHRRDFGRLMVEAARSAAREDRRYAYRVLFAEDLGIAYIFLATDMPRNERLPFLKLLMDSLATFRATELGARRVVGLATEASPAHGGSSFDVGSMAIDDLSESRRRELLQDGLDLFADPTRSRSKEFE